MSPCRPDLRARSYRSVLQNRDRKGASSTSTKEETRNHSCPTILSPKKVPTCCSTPTIQWTGIPGARRRSKKRALEDKPIFLSIGYSTCHWCHVMERESFENDDIAAILNRFFVPVKVDREERPDVDRIYMTFVQAIHRKRRLADVGIPHARAGAVLRRNLFRPGQSLWTAGIFGDSGAPRRSLERTSATSILESSDNVIAAAQPQYRGRFCQIRRA